MLRRLPARSVQAGVEIKLEFPFNASWACLCRQTGLPRGSLLTLRFVVHPLEPYFRTITVLHQ